MQAIAAVKLPAANSEHMAAMIVSTVISRFFFAKSSETSVWGLGTTHSYHSSSAQLALHPLSSHSRRCGSSRTLS